MPSRALAAAGLAGGFLCASLLVLAWQRERASVLERGVGASPFLGNRQLREAEDVFHQTAAEDSTLAKPERARMAEIDAKMRRAQQRLSGDRRREAHLQHMINRASAHVTGARAGYDVSVEQGTVLQTRPSYTQLGWRRGFSGGGLDLPSNTAGQAFHGVGPVVEEIGSMGRRHGLTAREKLASLYFFGKQ
mmetsp:Transcript_56800/g.139415  ORF Transcript_56800/g.139415 Transcript_56800/m.139415 type:complete len:191 (-) Transcript_56800:816-1388(-)